MKSNFTIFLLLIGFDVLSQTFISGTVKDKDQTPLLGTVVSVYVEANSTPVAYSIANIEGKYKCEIQVKNDSLRLQVSLLGYKTKELKVKNTTQKIDFVLYEHPENLKEVIVRSKPVEIRKDTITYRISSFKKSEDKVLIDVLKKLPGIEVKNNGTILYEGKAINKFYIENNDLLGGRYNLATHNLDINNISSVQVYEHHQPIKILDSLSYTDRAAINIKLKKNFAWGFPLEIAAGIPVYLWDLKTVPMFFSKKNQLLAELSANDTGKNLNNEIIEHIHSNSEVDKANSFGFLQLLKTDGPPIDEKRFLQNNSALMSFNFLTQLKRNNSLKIRLDFLPDIRTDKTYMQQQIKLDTNILETKYRFFTEEKQRLFQSNLIYEMNNEQTYLKTNFKIRSIQKSEQGEILNSEIKQNLSSPLLKLQNALNFLFPFGKQIISFNYYLKYIETNQQLNLKPGVFSEILNNEIPYNETGQFLERKQWEAKTGMYFTRKKNNFTFKDEVKLFYTKGQLVSGIRVDQNLKNEDVFNNKLYYTNWAIYNNLSVLFRKGNWFSYLKIPVVYKNFYLSDEINSQYNKGINKIFLPYNLGLNYTYRRWKYILSIDKRNVFGNLRNMYPSYILINRLNMERYDSPIPVQILNNIEVSVLFKDILSGFNAQFSAGYNKNKRNIIYQNQYFENAENTIRPVEIENVIYGRNIHLQLNKYYKPMKVYFKFNTRIDFYNIPYFINHHFYKSLSVNQDYTLQINLSLGKKTSLYNTLFYSIYNSKNMTQSVETFKYQSKIYFYLNSSHKVLFSQEYSKVNMYQSFFSDMEYTYQPQKKYWQVFVQVRNLLDNKIYTDIYQTDYFMQQNIYYLRPREIIFGMKFTF